MNHVKKRLSAQGFTLVEMLIVIAIILLLAGMILPVVGKAKEKAHLAECINQLSQLGKGIAMFQQDTRDLPPLFLRNMLNVDVLTSPTPAAYDYWENYSNYLTNPALLVCPKDHFDGNNGPIPPTLAPTSPYRYAELVEPSCSYQYFFQYVAVDTTKWDYQNDGLTEPLDASGAVDWTLLDTVGVSKGNPDGQVSWWEAKMWQMRFGDTVTGNTPYPPSKFPMIRCQWHASDVNATDKKGIVNLGAAYNTFQTGQEWKNEVGP